MIKKDLRKKIPDSPGVYFFRKKRVRRPLYIGKATSLPDRVKSYFSNETVSSRGPRIVKMINEADFVDFIKTDSVLEALILETELIKKEKPTYNSRERDDKSFNYVVITNEEYPRLELVRGKELRGIPHETFKKIFGPYPHGGELRAAIKIIRKIFPWRDKKCIPLSGKPCFNKQIGLCPGVCVGLVNKSEYIHMIRNVSHFLSGKKSKLIRTLKNDMKEHSTNMEFEKAAQIRNQLFALKHIHDVALLKREEVRDERRERIEAYDIAHLAGTSVVGVMVVLESGKLAKNEYRKFRIRSKNGIDDVGNLEEILKRRLLHDEWTRPNLIVVDGAIAQVNAAKKVLRELHLNLPIVGVVKDSRHKAHHFVGTKDVNVGNKENIILANAEAHRFAITYHKDIRSRGYK